MQIQQQKKRKPWVAVVFSFLCPGLGQLYNGDIRGPIASFLISVPLTFLATVYLFDSFAKLMSAIALGLAIDIVFAIHAYRQAKRLGVMTLNKYQRWWIYPLFVAALYGVPDGYGFLIPTRIQSFQIPSESMLPTLLVGDRLVADGWAYWGKDPQVGDIIVFDYPKDPKIKYVKRCLGVPGDVVEFRGGEFFRNGEKVAFTQAGTPDLRKHGWDHREFHETLGDVKHSFYRVLPPEAYNIGPLTVPEGHYFAIGDNRDRSSDSRVWGFVPRDMIIARMSYIFFSWDDDQKRIRTDRIGMPVR